MQSLTVAAVFAVLVASSTAAFGYDFTVSDQLNALCAGLSNSGECADAIEKYQLQKAPKIVKREGHKLTIRIRESKSTTLTDSDVESDAVKVYRYLQYISEVGYHLVLVHYWEDLEFMLVSNETGKKYTINNTPHFSPDHKYLATDSKGEASLDNGIYIHRLEKSGIVRVFAYDPPDIMHNKKNYYAQYFFVGWNGNLSARFWKYTYADRDLCPTSNHMNIMIDCTLHGAKWTLSENRGSVVCDREDAAEQEREPER